MQIDHRLLNRMEDAADGEILDRDQFGAVELAEKQDAGVDGLVAEAAPAQPGEHDRAGAAVAFVTPLFGPPGERLLAQPVEYGRARREAVERDVAAAEPEAQLSRGVVLNFVTMPARWTDAA